jgi:molecular chaperone GrpE
LSDEIPSPDSAEALLQRARLAEGRLAEVLAAYRTLKTENDGYRDRITRNLERRYDQRRERLLLRFIEILDNLDRALESAERSYLGDSVVEGLILVRTQLLQTLKEEGLERIPVVGLAYDPAVSEAVGTEPVGDPDQHHVVLKDLLRGYRLAGRIARASKVVVGEYRAEGATAAPAEVPAQTVIGEATDDVAGIAAATPTPETAAATSNGPVPAAQAAKKKGEKEITFSKLDLDLASAVHEAAEAATEIEDTDSLAEIVADAETAVGTAAPGRDHDDRKKDD